MLLKHNKNVKLIKKMLFETLNIAQFVITIYWFTNHIVQLYHPLNKIQAHNCGNIKFTTIYTKIN